VHQFDALGGRGLVALRAKEQAVYRARANQFP
jgi:hypothetical protein